MQSTTETELQRANILLVFSYQPYPYATPVTNSRALHIDDRFAVEFVQEIMDYSQQRAWELVAEEEE